MIYVYNVQICMIIYRCGQEKHWKLRLSYLQWLRYREGMQSTRDGHLKKFLCLLLHSSIAINPFQFHHPSLFSTLISSPLFHRYFSIFISLFSLTFELILLYRFVTFNIYIPLAHLYNKEMHYICMPCFLPFRERIYFF